MRSLIVLSIAGLLAAGCGATAPSERGTDRFRPGISCARIIGSVLSPPPWVRRKRCRRD